MPYENVEAFRNVHQEKKVFILASGPSLKDCSLEPLRRRISIGLNRSFLVFPESQYHCAMDERLFDQYDQALRQTRYLFTFEDRPFGIPLRLLGSEGFSFDLAEGIYSGYTVSFFALQLAVYMGFKQVFYLGLDLKHRAGQTHFFGSDSVSRDHEHTEFPKMARMMGYAADALADSGVEVFNCSPISTLDCFPRVSYEWAFQQ